MATVRTPARRPLLLVLLQTEATALMSLAIGQAGLASGFLTGHGDLKPIHAVNALVLVALTVGTIVTAVAYQRQGGPRWPAAAALVLLLLEGVQITLARLDVAGAHIFIGVLFVVSATLYTSYLFRLGFALSRQA
jgi:uncharacterized membrane protein YfcA